MKALEVLAHLGVDDPADCLTSYWDESHRTYPQTHTVQASRIRFLQPEAIIQTRTFAGLPHSADATLLAAAAQIRGSAELSALIWHCSHLAFEQFEFPAAQIRHWPDPIPALGELSGAFYLLIDISASGMASRDFALELISEHKVAVAPGSTFGDMCASHVRVSIASPDEMVREGIERICTMVQQKAASR